MLLPRGFHPLEILGTSQCPPAPSSGSSRGSCPSLRPRWVEQPLSSPASFIPNSCLRGAIQQEPGRTKHRFWLGFPSPRTRLPALFVLPSLQPTGSRVLLPFPASSAHTLVLFPSLVSSSFSLFRCLLTPSDFPLSCCPPPGWSCPQRVLCKALEDLHPPKVGPGQVTGGGGRSPSLRDWSWLPQNGTSPIKVWVSHGNLTAPSPGGGGGSDWGTTGRNWEPVVG